ncbi:MAG TPA: thioesterase family protein [Syntrophorhabdaceae bacterium]|nr:thioesterase family protein [Syntrophorhabdaceae bacterium]
MRVKLLEQDWYEFQFSIVVREGHVNEADHVGYDSIVQMIGEARIDLLRKLGFTQLDIGEQKTGIIMRDLVITYHEEGSLFDEIVIDSHAGEITRSSFRLFHRLTRKNRIIALAETGLSCFNYEIHKVVRLPEVFLEALEAYKTSKERQSVFRK